MCNRRGGVERKRGNPKDGQQDGQGDKEIDKEADNTRQDRTGQDRYSLGYLRQTKRSTEAGRTLEDR